MTLSALSRCCRCSLKTVTSSVERLRFTPFRLGPIQQDAQWPDVLKLAKNGNPAPARKVARTEAEWRQQLTR